MNTATVDSLKEFAAAYTVRRSRRSAQQQILLETMSCADIEGLRNLAQALEKKRESYRMMTALGVLGLGVLFMVDSFQAPALTFAYLLTGVVLLFALFNKTKLPPFPAAHLVATILEPLAEEKRQEELVKMARQVPMCDAYLRKTSEQERVLLSLDYVLVREMFFEAFVKVRKASVS